MIKTNGQRRLSEVVKLLIGRDDLVILGYLVDLRERLGIMAVDNHREGGIYRLEDQRRIVEEFNKSRHKHQRAYREELDVKLLYIPVGASG